MDFHPRSAEYMQVSRRVVSTDWTSIASWLWSQRCNAPLKGTVTCGWPSGEPAPWRGWSGAVAAAVQSDGSRDARSGRAFESERSEQDRNSSTGTATISACGCEAV